MTYGKKPTNMTQVVIDDVVYESLVEASKQTGIPSPTILWRIKSKNKKMKDKLIKTEHYNLLNSEIEPGVGIEVFRVWNSYYDLPKEKKIEMLETLITWGKEELNKVKLTINSTSNDDMNIGVYPLPTTPIN